MNITMIQYKPQKYHKVISHGSRWTLVVMNIATRKTWQLELNATQINVTQTNSTQTNATQINAA